MTQAQRDELDEVVISIADAIETTDELSYVIGKLVDETIIDQIGDQHTVRTILGVLEGAKLDFYQRHAVPLTIGDLHASD